MRERLKRRKKEPEKPGAEAAPAPLQPAFYDTQAPSEAAESLPIQTADQPEAEQPEPQGVESQADSAASPATGGNGDAAKRRRRRSRGGRGRRRSGRPAGAVRTENQGDVSPQPVAEAASAASVQEQPAAAPVQIPQAPPRPPKGTVVLAIGLPGSGKSAWFKRHNITPLSSDLLRAMLFDDPTEQRFQDLIFSNLRSMLKARLIARRPMNYVDATNLTPHERHGWIKLAKDFGYEVQAVFFDVPVDVCLERNRKRERVVPEDVMRRMAGKLKAPTFDEGFAKITVVRVKQKESSEG
ncbi:MAG TPA: AAA family ATPase [Terriglobales bacterium]|nr:AAA family ATPase [Terriglobales bacterium]